MSIQPPVTYGNNIADSFGKTFTFAGPESIKGVLILLSGEVGNPYTGITYGGQALTQVVTQDGMQGIGELQIDNISAWLLPSGAPSGDQQIVISGGPATALAHVFAANTEGGNLVLKDFVAIAQNEIANPSGLLELGGDDAFCALMFVSGQDATANVTPLTNWTERYAGFDIGARVIGGCHSYDIIDSTDVTAGVQQATNDILLVAVAIGEEAAPAQQVTGSGQFEAEMTASLAGSGTSAEAAAQQVTGSGQFAVSLSVSFSSGSGEAVPLSPPANLAASALSVSEIQVSWDTQVGDGSYDLRFRSTVELPAVTTQSNAPWQLERIYQQGSPASTDEYQYRYTGAGVYIYIVDTGVTPHAQFGERLLAGIDLSGSGTTSDSLFHGTSVAGCAAGSIAGTAKGAYVVPVKIIEDFNEEAVDEGIYIDALEWILANHPEGARAVVINCTAPEFVDVAAVKAAWQNLIDAGFVCLMCAFNNGQNVSATTMDALGPLAMEGIIVVGGLQDDGVSWWPSSNSGDWIDIIAPSENVADMPHFSGTGTRTASGTSYGTPLVGGVCAMLLEENPHASPQRIKELLLQQATPDVVTGIPGGSPTPNLLLYSGATATEWTEHTDVSQPYTVEDLEPSTEYDLAVRRTVGDVTTEWTTETQATTQALASASGAGTFAATLSVSFSGSGVSTLDAPQQVTGSGQFNAGSLSASLSGAGALQQSIINVGGGWQVWDAGSLSVAFSGSGVASTPTAQQVTGDGQFSCELVPSFSGQGTIAHPQQVEGTGLFSTELQVTFNGTGAAEKTTQLVLGTGVFGLGLSAGFIGAGTSIDVVPPAVKSAYIRGDELVITCSEPVLIGTGGSGGFALSASGGAVTATFDRTYHQQLYYNLSRSVDKEESVTLGYTQPGDGVVDRAGNDLASFSDLGVSLGGGLSRYEFVSDWFLMRNR